MSRSSSAVVDTKVAELQLDNSNFEKNAATTISTVQELQKALNFSVSGKNFDEINASVKKVNFDPINKGIETTKAGFSALEAVAFGAFARIGSKIADVGMNIVSAIPKQIVEGGKSRALNVQQAKFQIQGLADSMNYVGDAWEDLSADIDHAVSGTAYGMDVAALAASQLMASGIKFGETFGPTGSSPMAKALRGISGVAAMTSSSYEEITNIFTKIAGQGSIMGGELQQLASRGLNVSADLAKFFNGVNDGSIQASETVTKAVKDVTTSVNTSEADIMDWASKRKISFEVFAEAMDRAYGEHATEANKTFAGSLTNVKAQLSKIGEVFAEPVFRNGQKFFSSLYDVVKDLRIIIQNSKFAKWFDETADKVGDKFASAFGKAHNALQNFISSKDNKTVETFRTAFGGIFDKVDEKTGVISKMRDYFGLGEVAKDAEENSKKIEGSFDSVKDTVLSTIRGDYANGMERVKNLTEAGFNPEQIQGYVNQLWELTGHDWSKLSDDIYAQVTAQEELSEATEETGKTTEESMGPIGHVLSGLLNLWSGISNVVGIAKNLLTGAWNSFTGVEGPVGRIAEKFDEISTAFNEFTQSHAGEIEQVFTGIGNAVLLVWDALSMGSKFVLGFISGILEGFGMTLWDLIVVVSNAITNFRTWIKENKILERTIDAVRNGAKWLTTTLRGLWDSFLNLPLVKKAVESFGEVFTHLRDNFLSVTQKGGKVLSRFWSMLRVGFKSASNPKELFGNIKGAFTYLWSEIKNSVTFSKIKEAFGNIKEYIATFFDDLGKNEDGSLNTFGKLRQGFGKFISGIGNSIKQFQKDGSFSNLFGNIKLTFQGLWNSVKSSGFFENIKKGFDTVRTAVDDFLTSLGTNKDGTKNWFGTAYDFVKSFASGILDSLGTIGTGFKDFFVSLPGFISGIPEKFQEFLDKVHELGGFKFENLGDIWQAFKDTIWQYFQDGDLFQPIIDAFGTLKDNIKQKLEENGIDVDGIIEKLVWFKDKIVEIFHNIKSSLSESFGDLTELGPVKAILKLFGGEDVQAAEKKAESTGKKLKKTSENFKTFFDTFTENFKESTFGKIAIKIGKFLGKIGNALLELDPDTIFNIVKAFIAFKVVKGIWKEIKGFIQEFTDSITGLWDSQANLNNAKANFINKAVWIEIAAAIAIIGSTIAKLASIKDMEKAKTAAIILGGVLAALFVVTLILSKVDKQGNSLKVGAGIFLVGLAIVAVGLIIKELASMDNLDKAWDVLKMLGIVFGVMSVVMIVGAKLGGSAAAAFGLGMLEMAAAFAVAAIGLKILESVDFASIVQHLVDAVNAWNKGIADISPEEIDGSKSAELLLILAGITAVIGAAEVVAFIGAVGEFVNGLMGNNTTLMQQFEESVRALVRVVHVWNEEMAELQREEARSMDGGTGGKSFEVLATLAGIEAVIGGAQLTSFIGAVEKFVYGLMGGTESMMELFEQNVEALIRVIHTWHDTIMELNADEVSEVYLKSFLILVALAGIEAIIAGAELESFLGAVGDFVYGQLGNSGTLMGRFEENVGHLLDIIHTWHDQVLSLDASEVSEVYLKSFLILSTLAGIELVIASAELTAFIGSVEDFVYGKMGGSGTLMQKFGQNVDILISTIKKWHETAQTVDIPEANNLTAAVRKINSTIDYIDDTSFWNNIESWFQGKEDYIETFKKNAKKLGQALTNFMNAFEADPSKLDQAEKIVRSLARLGANISMFVMDTGAMGEGRSNLEQFGDLLGDSDYGLGRKLKNFVENCPDEGQLTTITTNFRSLINGIKQLEEVDLSESDVFDDAKTQALQTSVSRLSGALIALTGASMLSFGIDGFLNSLTKLSTITLSGDLLNEQLVSKFMTSIDRLASKISSISIDTTQVDNFTNSLSKLSSTKLDAGDMGSDTGSQISDNIGKNIDPIKISSGISGALSSAMSGIDVSSFSSVGQKIAGQIAAGVSKSGNTIKTVIGTIMKSASDKVSEYKSDFGSAGTNLVTGLANGIRNNKSAAINAAADVAAQALAAAKDRLKIQSPSKEMERIGMYFDFGFAKGVSKFASKVYDESSDVARLAMDGLSQAVMMANDILEDGDTQPVIRPVLDLSDVESGALGLNGLFNTAPFISTNLGAIGANADVMRSRNTTDDILTALSELGQSMNTGTGDTYIIDGVTYDDGSNVSDAVQRLIRAAKIERRA